MSVKAASLKLIAMLCDDNVPVERRVDALSAIDAGSVTGPALAAMAEYLLSQAMPLRLEGMDVCGTGGDNGKGCVKTFNVSTASAFVLAGGGVSVVKHGNRAVSSTSGSSDVLAALGVPVCATAEEAQAQHGRHNLCFIAAPAFHPVLKNVAAVRKALGRPTFFNLLGPLCNPARVRRQIIGVFDDRCMEPMADAARLLGKTDVMIVHGDDGLDEISLCTTTHMLRLKDGSITHETVRPEDMELESVLPQDVAGGTPEENAAIIRAALAEGVGAAADIIIANAAAGFVLAGKAETLKDGARMARDVIFSGAALKKLKDMAPT